MNASAPDQKAIEQTVLKLETEFLQALENQNEVALIPLLSPGLIFSSPWGDVVDTDDFLEVVSSGEITLEKVTPREFDIHVHGMAAIVVSYVDLAGVFFGEEVEGEFQFIRTWAPDENGQWQMLTSHSFEEDALNEDEEDEDGDEGEGAEGEEDGESGSVNK
jgi:hypothetical protein